MILFAVSSAVALLAAGFLIGRAYERRQNDAIRDSIAKIGAMVAANHAEALARAALAA